MADNAEFIYPSDEYTIDELLEVPVEDLGSLDAERLLKTTPYVVAEFLERMDLEDRRAVLRLLDEDAASMILSEMDAEESAEVVGAMRENRAVKIIEELDADDAADLMAELDESDRNRLLGKVTPETAHTVRELLSYDPDTAGGIMNPQVATIQPQYTIDQAIQTIRQLKEEYEDIYYIYVVDSKNHLLGHVKMRDLILAQPKQSISSIMSTELRGVCTPDLDREFVARTMAELNFHALPVIDSDGRLLGIVSHDDVIDIITEEATEDMQKLVGAGADESIHDPIVYSLKQRTPWLLFNLLTASLAVVVISQFEGIINKLTILAALMPMIAGVGGNTGQQTLAVAIRSIALNEIASGDNRTLIIREGLKGLASSVSVGLLAAIGVWAFTHSVEIAGVVLLAMVLTMTLAGLVGAFIPLLLRRFKFDPAQSSSIFLTTVTDISGFFIFLLLAQLLL